MNMVTGNMTASKEVRGADFYPSPYAVVPALLEAERRHLPKSIWEPSCGDGALVLPLRNRGFDVTATDIHDWGCPESAGGVDFLAPDAVEFAPAQPFGIISNPPFGIVRRYIEQAVGMTPYVALLLRLAFLESEDRREWFPAVGLRRVHVIADRLPMMHRHGYAGPRVQSGGMCFAWFVFEPSRRPQRAVSLDWVSWKEAIQRHPMTDADIPPTRQH